MTLELLQDTSSVTLSLHHLLESQSRRLWGSQSTKDGGSGLEMNGLLLDTGISILNVLRAAGRACEASFGSPPLRSRSEFKGNLTEFRGVSESYVRRTGLTQDGRRL